jgi:hypothetical protein
MENFARLLSRSINFSVVQLPDRSYPGVVVQGDTLNGLVHQIGRMERLLEKGDLEDLRDELLIIHKQLSEAQGHYENVCQSQGITLPY